MELKKYEKIKNEETHGYGKVKSLR